MKFELYYPDETLQLDMTDRIPKFLGFGNPTLTKSGTLTDIRCNENNVWFSPIGSSSFSVLFVPILTFSGNTFTWDSRGLSGFDFIYGIY